MSTRSNWFRVPVSVLVGLSLVGASCAQAGIITSIATRNTSRTYTLVPDGLAEDALSFTDRTHEYNQIPPFLLGLDYVKTPNDDKTDPDLELDITLATSGHVYMLLDTRVGGLPWMTSLGFQDTGYDIGIDEKGDGNIDQWSSVFVGGFPAGTVTLYEQNDGSKRNMYGVAAYIPEPTTMGLLALGGLALARRRRRR